MHFGHNTQPYTRLQISDGPDGLVNDTYAHFSYTEPGQLCASRRPRLS